LDQIGAEPDFVRRPFIYAGALLLGVGAAGALGLLALARALANPPLAELGGLFGIQLQLGFLPWPLLLSFVAAVCWSELASRTSSPDVKLRWLRIRD